MEFTNLSDKALRFRGSKEGLKKMILLPDYCPGAGGLPVGVVAVYDGKNHKIHADYLGPDVGCGMTFAKFREAPDNGLDHLAFSVANELASYSRKAEISLGGGNHFINLYEVKEIKEVDECPDLVKGDNVVLVHSGSGQRGRNLYESNPTNEDYVSQYNLVVESAKKNRAGLIDVIKEKGNMPVDILFDRVHNTVEVEQDEVVYRKGSIKLLPGQCTVIPSSMAGDALLVRAKQGVVELENSMVHGTGRKISRSESKTKDLFFDEIRKRIYLPSFIPDKSIRTEHPDCYRSVEDILPALEKYVEVLGVLEPKAGIL